MNITPNDYHHEGYIVSPQNWGFIQHDDGRIFIGNTSGVLSWDGGSWEQVQGTENKRFLKFDEDKDGRIYTGGIGDIGYLGADSVGRATFISLKSELPDSVQDFDQIYRIVCDSNRTFFLGGIYLFCWEEGEFRVWKNRDKFRRIFALQSGVFITTGTNLFRLSGGVLQPVTSNPKVGELAIRGLKSHSDAWGREYLWLVTDSEGIYSLKDDQLMAVNSNIDSLEVMNTVDLENGEIGLGTNGDGFVIIDSTGSVSRIVNEESGILNSQIPFPYKGKFSGIWLCKYVGLSRIPKKSPVEIFGLDDKLVSPVISVHVWKGNVFIGSMEGVYLINDLESKEVTQVDIPCGEVHDFFELDGALWMVTVEGVYKIDPELNFSKNIGFEDLEGYCKSWDDPNRIFVSTITKSLRTLIYEKGSWVLGPDSVGLTHHGWSLVQGRDEKIWIAQADLSYVTFENGVGKVKTLGPKDGLPAEAGILEVQEIQNEIVVSCKQGPYFWSEEEKKLLPYEGLGEIFTKGKYSAYNITQSQNGDVWVTSDFGTGILKHQNDGTYEIDSLVMASAPISDYFCIYEDKDGIIWLGGTEGLVRFDPSIEKDYQVDYYTLVRQVTVNSDSVIFYGTFADESGLIVSEQPEKDIPTLSYTDNHLTFRFAAPFFEAPEKLRYSHQLIGQEEKWTSWTDKTETEYTNLWEGEYIFRVRARNVFGTISKIGEYRFEILAPWYRSIWAYLFYGLLVVLLVILIVRLNSRRLLAAKRRLEEIVDERTNEIQRQMKQLAKQKEMISAEKEISDNLLLNILPKATSEELKEKGVASPKNFEQVTVMFTDFKGFTMIAEHLSPKQLVDEIHECFSEFDRITKRYGIEKIKTIGDAYMAAGGLPEVNSTNPIDVVSAALEIRDYMAKYLADRAAIGEKGFEIRLGVHTGPVVAGIVGLHKFQYDIWGDAVNTAARMESSGEVGKVNISHATYELVKDQFDCAFRGNVKAKNKGEIAMYFVEWKNEQ